MSLSLVTAKKVAITAAAVVWFWLAPIRAQMLTATLMALLDLMLALLVTFREQKPPNFAARMQLVQSGGLKRTFAKIMMWNAGFILAYATETYLTGEWAPLVRIATGVCGLSELKSCLEHLDELNGNPLFKAVLNKLAPLSAYGAPPAQEPPPASAPATSSEGEAPRGVE